MFLLGKLDVLPKVMIENVVIDQYQSTPFQLIIIFCVTCLSRKARGGGGALECQGGFQARPKIHVIRVVFQDQTLYARISFRGAKTCKIGK